MCMYSSSTIIVVESIASKEFVDLKGISVEKFVFVGFVLAL